MLVNLTNIRGLSSNLEAVELHLATEKPHILCLGETQVRNFDMAISKYTIIQSFFDKRGIAIFVRDDVSYDHLHELSGNHPEFHYTWIKARYCSKTLFLCFLYRSPNSSMEVTESVYNKISAQIGSLFNKSPNSEVIIAGDFNVHNQNWLKFSSKTDAIGRLTELFCLTSGLEQLVNAPTRIPDKENEAPHLLDLVLSSHPHNHQVTVNAPLGNSDHCVVSLTLPSSEPITKENRPPKRKVWHYNRANWDALNTFFKNLDWNCLFKNADIDTAVQRVTQAILSGMHNFIPSSFKRPKTSSSSWFTTACDGARKKKKQAFCEYLNNPSHENRMTFIAARNSCNKTLKAAKSAFEKKMKTRFQNDPKGQQSFWAHLNRIKNNFAPAPSTPPLQTENGVVVNPREKAEIFAKRFAENSTLPPTNQTFTCHAISSAPFPVIHFRRRVIRKVLKELDTKKASGADGISAFVLKKCASALCKPLSKLFHLSYSTGSFPTAWKTALVQPVPKKGKKNDPSNYRPIALTSILSKVMEKIVNQKLLTHLEKFKLLSDRQYGFRSSRSTGDLMTYITEQWNRSMDKLGETYVVGLDISKAFDRVWHEALLAKLDALGLGVPLVKWVQSFLSGRSIRVVLDGFTSKNHYINAGVPQGSVLSPTLFLAFINDLLSATKNPIHSFADDSTLHFSSKVGSLASSNVQTARTEIVHSLNDDIQKILEWGRVNRVQFNSKKTQVCHITLRKDKFSSPIKCDNLNLSYSEEINMLGMKIGTKLQMNEMIHDFAKNASRRLGLLRRCKKFFNSDELLRIYKAYIRPLLEYNSHIWAGAPKESLKLLDTVQKYAIQIINDPKVTIQLDSLAHRRNVGSLTLYYRYFNGRCSDEIQSLVPPLKTYSRTLRANSSNHSYVVDIPKHRTSKLERSFFYRTSKLWNQLPGLLFPSNYNLQKFKTSVHFYLKNNPLS